MSVDPVTALGGDMRHFNRYAYAFNNPYKFTDPDGRAAICLVPGPMQACMAAGAVVVDVAVKVATIAGVLWVANEAIPTPETPAVAEPGTAESDEGCIYCVPGEHTKSGDDYVGSADDLDRRAQDKSDGRDRTKAEKIDSYKKGDRTDRQNKEQKAMNDRGGKDKLDNKRNEVAPRKWEERGIKPPQQK